MFSPSPTRSSSSPTLLTEAQAATAAQVDKRTIRRLIQDGRLRAVDYGSGKRHHYRINPDDLTDIKPPSTLTPLPRAPRRRPARASFSSSISAYLPTV
jgi:excisionase family DNA binding protein